MKPFRRLNARKTKYGFEAYVYADRIVAIGKAVEAVNNADAAAIVAINASGGACILTIHSNVDMVNDIMATYVEVPQQ